MLKNLTQSQSSKSISFQFTKILLSLVFLIAQGVLYAQENLVTQGFEKNISELSYPEMGKYRSVVDYPAFVGWSLNGKKMLFNGGKVLYAMKSHNSNIRDYKNANEGFRMPLSPNHDYFLYQEDEAGNEDYQLFLYNIANQNSTALTKKGDKSYDAFWSPGNDTFLYKSNKRNPDAVDLYVRSISGYEKLIFENFSDDCLIYDWSADKNLILATKVISENDKSLYLINDRTFEVEQINQGKKNIAYSEAKFIPNQNACLIVSDEFSEFLQLQYYDVGKKTFQTITYNIPWDIEALSVAKKGNYAAFSVNENGFSKLYVLDLETLSYQAVSDFPSGVIGNLSINTNGTEIGLNLYSSTFRRKVFGYTIADKTLKRYHYKKESEIPKDSMRFTQAETFTFPSVDSDTKERYEIPAFMYRARSTEKASPVFIDFHGGPEYQIRATFNGFYQYLVNELGITVIVPNIRGSNGYGKSYMKMDDGLNRENAIEDVGALLDWIETQEDLDATRVSVHGESYGGFVALSALTHISDRIACGVDIVGISNWVTYLKNTRGYRRDLRRVEFGDERKPKTLSFLNKISPYQNVDAITVPLLIFQGKNDPRVNYQESEQMFESLKEKGRDVWYVLAKDEGHGFQKYSNYLYQRNLTVSFLKKHLIIE